MSLLENPKSEPVPNTPIKDCTTPRCYSILKSRLSFLGRYIFDRDNLPLLKSESSVILRAIDIGAMETYISIQTLIDTPDPDIDDYSHERGSVHALQILSEPVTKSFCCGFITVAPNTGKQVILY